MRLKFATMEVNGTPRISMSISELQEMLDSLDRSEQQNNRLVEFLETLKRELLAA